MFLPGVSGNPAGRKKGSTNKSTKLRLEIEGRLSGIIARLIEAAENGDVSAAGLLFSRALPALKPIDSPTPLPLGADLSSAVAAVLAALASGHLTPDQAGSVASVLASLSRVREAADLERRITDLETALATHCTPS